MLYDPSLSMSPFIYCHEKNIIIVLLLCLPVSFAAPVGLYLYLLSLSLSLPPVSLPVFVFVYPETPECFPEPPPDLGRAGQMLFWDLARKVF